MTSSPTTPDPASGRAAEAPGDTGLERYARQMRFDPIGADGQRRLLQSRVTLVGCGALGTVIADTLVRSGIGFLHIIDRDFIELSNLQRQVLFDEQDVIDVLPKAEAARRKLARINSGVEVQAMVEDANHTNIEDLVAGSDLILDGTDNFQTRYLINDVAVKHGKPWIYGACVSASGLVMPIVPGRTPCLRCLFDQAPPPEMSPTCDTAGVIAPIVGVVASLQATEAIKLLSGNADAVQARLTQIDLWSGRFISVEVGAARGGAEACACCGRGDYEYLAGRAGQTATTLCGRSAVQVHPLQRGAIDLQALERKLAAVADGEVRRNEFMLQAAIGEHQLTVFPNGRVIIKGTTRPEEARSIYARYIGA